MDPNQALADLKAAIKSGNRTKAEEIRENLHAWVENGGFKPSDKNWWKY